MPPASTAAATSWRGEGRLGPRTHTPLLRSGASRYWSGCGVADALAGAPTAGVAAEGADAEGAGDAVTACGCVAFVAAIDARATAIVMTPNITRARVAIMSALLPRAAAVRGL